MSYGSRLEYEGRVGKTPPGKTHWKEAVNNVRGVLKWSLTFLDPEDVVEILSEVRRKKLRGQHFDDLDDRLEHLQLLEQYHQHQIETVQKDIERVESIR